MTDAVAMDCEMVGVGQGNKSALGRVTLVIICAVSSCYCLLRFLFLIVLSNSGDSIITYLILMNSI